MRFKYVGGIGVPKNCKITYDPNRKILKTIYVTVNETDNSFFVCTPDLKLKLRFSMTDGVFVGLSCDCLELDLLPRRKIEIAYAPDGEVKVDCPLKGIIADCTYFGFDGGACYDESKKAVLFGAISDNDAVYRVLDNAYLSISCDGSLSGVYVKL
ncbi:MAG: hypothetical protein K2I17_05045 [Clostridia bacterium]|nr:hypothetical protein [Clostridia bacterium]